MNLCLSFWNPAFICGKSLVFSCLRRAVALCVPCFSDLLRFLKLLFLICFYQSSFFGSLRKLSFSFFFRKITKISLILLFFEKKKKNSLFFLLFVISFSCKMSLSCKIFKNTALIFLCCQPLFENILFLLS